ncbi:BLUF domain-containing protein [Aquimarina sp. D1M17]|uniref:BLUF domain-containing protein n=1 Tax=Aquimarina acroporae TaxID=2937283 RepID=UPI0020BE161A|nr:BLUF domain-containing protein [Aquimarina acroporae]MCK8523309.1 BLUF domain-containing protein [Aquimarina acroporae]
MSKLACCLYISIENQVFDEQKISELIKKARLQNQKNNITGFLYYRQNHFFQYIEGDPNDLDNLLQKLQDDSRHTILNRASDKDLKERRFDNWSMGNLKTDELIQIKLEDIILDYLSWLKTYKGVEFENTWSIIDKLAEYRNKGALS